MNSEKIIVEVIIDKGESYDFIIRTLADEITRNLGLQEKMNPVGNVIDIDCFFVSNEKSIRRYDDGQTGYSLSTSHTELLIDISEGYEPENDFYELSSSFEDMIDHFFWESNAMLSNGGVFVAICRY